MILSEPNKSAAADEENLLGVDLDVFLVRMLAAALRRNVARRALEDLQQRLLHAFAGDIARDGDVVCLAPDLVDFVDVNDADLGALHVVIGILQQAENDVLHVLADITRLGQGGRVGDAEWNIENPRERAGQQRLAGAGRADEQDVALLDLHVGERIQLDGAAYRGRAVVQDSLVVIVDRDREGLLRVLLADDVLIERSADFGRLRHADRRSSAGALLH